MSPLCPRPPATPTPHARHTHSHHTCRGTTQTRRVQEWWPAFEAIGLGKVPRVTAYGDADFPADYMLGDARFSAIAMGFGIDTLKKSPLAIAESLFDPRTGQILVANVAISVEWGECMY